MVSNGFVSGVNESGDEYVETVGSDTVDFAEGLGGGTPFDVPPYPRTTRYTKLAQCGTVLVQRTSEKPSGTQHIELTLTMQEVDGLFDLLGA